MFRVAENFTIYNGNKLNGSIKGLTVGEVKKHAIMAVKRECSFVKDYESRENYEKNFTVLNDDMVNILTQFGVSDISAYENKIEVVLLDEPKTTTSEEPMTWRKWHEERIKK